MDHPFRRPHPHVQVARLGRHDQRRLHPRGQRQVGEGLLGLRGLLVLGPPGRVLDQARQGVDGHLPGVQHQVVARRVAPVGAEDRLHAPGARLVDAFYVAPAAGLVEPFPLPHLLHLVLQRRRQQHFQHVAYARQEFLAHVAVIDDLAVAGHLAHGRLERDAVQPQALAPAHPPVRPRFQNLFVFGLGNAVPVARLHQHLTVHARAAQISGNPLGNLRTRAKRATNNGDNRHGLPSFLSAPLPTAAKAAASPGVEPE